MRKVWFWILAIGIGTLLVCIAFPVGGGKPIPPHRIRALSEARQVALALRLYADDHGSRMPAALNELMPHYLPPDASHLVRHMTLTMPRARLKDMPADYIIAWKLIPKDGDRIVAVHPDASAEIVRSDPN